jgi:hypothetical protein
MKVGGEDESKKYFWDREVNLRDVNTKYGCLVVFIRHDSAEIWGFRYGLTLGIGTLKTMASTGVFVRVVFALKRPISSFSRTSSMILIYLKHRKSHSHQRWAQREICTRGGNAQNKHNANRE